MALEHWTDAQVIDQLDSGLKWSSQNITYAFPTTLSGLYVNSGEAGGFRPVSEYFQRMATIAITSWDDLIAPDFSLTTSARSDIEFGLTNTGIGYAHAYYPTAGSAWFNHSQTELTSPIIGDYGFKTLLHEIGHTIGLSHMGNYNGNGNWLPSSYQDTHVYSVMSYFGPDGPYTNNQVAQADWTNSSGTASPQTPMINDILAMQYKYGAETTTRTDATIYGFGSNIVGMMMNIFDFSLNRNPVLAIYDNGGIDTLDLSGFDTSCEISLVPGTFSDCNGMTKNISIYYTTVIENAVGGLAEDTIIGNTADNKITGGSGNDTINGGDGIDIAAFSGFISAYTILWSATGSYTIIDDLGDDGSDQLTSIEVFQFLDQDFITSDTAPVLTAALMDQSAVLDAEFTFTVPVGAFIDQDGASLNYTATRSDGSALPSWLSFDSTLRTFSGIPADGDIDTFSIVVRASDGQEWVTDTFSLWVGNAIGKDVVGTSEADDLEGTYAGEKILGLGRRDTIHAGARDDILIGGTGADTLWGEGGADIFAYKSISEANDVIMDFSRIDGDKMDFRAIDANSGKAGNQAFKFAGDNDWGKAGQIIYYFGGESTQVFGFTDKDAKAEFSFWIEGEVDFKARDFML